MVRPLQEGVLVARGLAVAQAVEASGRGRRLLSGRVLRVLPLADIHVVTLFEGETEESLADALMATGLYEFAEPDWIVYPARREPETRPDDPVLRAQWQLDKIRAPRAWNGFTGDGSITCAFVDSGVDLAHPDLAPLLVPGYNCPNNLTQAAGGDVSDINGHGTSVAGAAVAMGNNYSGGSGVCWSARIMPIRATNVSSGAAFMSDILYGAAWAAFNGARIVSVSYAGVENSSVEPTGQAIRQNYGGLLFWAAGNNSTNLSGIDYPSTTIVGSTDSVDALAWNTNFGRAIDVMAPGVAVWVPTMGGGYAARSGTSFATPIAAGVLALAWSAAPWMTPDQAMSALYLSCNALEPVNEFNNTGWGRVNAHQALQLAVGGQTPAIPTILAASSVATPLLPGLTGRYFGALGVLGVPQFGGTPLATTIAESVYFPAAGPGMPSSFIGCPLVQDFGLTLEGYIEVPATRVYTLTLTSRDGSRLFVDDRMIVNNDGLHPVRFRSGSVWLERGLHRLRCDYFSSTDLASLVLSIRGDRLGEVVIPAGMFYREPPSAMAQPVIRR